MLNIDNKEFLKKTLLKSQNLRRKKKMIPSYNLTLKGLDEKVIQIFEFENQNKKRTFNVAIT